MTCIPRNLIGPLPVQVSSIGAFNGVKNRSLHPKMILRALSVRFCYDTMEVMLELCSLGWLFIRTREPEP